MEEAENAMADEDSYGAIIGAIFETHYRKSLREFEFSREEIRDVARRLGVALPKNLGDLIYSYRFRRALPKQITRTAPKDKEWIIELAGRGKYRFRLAAINRIVPRSDLIATKVPEATPEIIAEHALNDEQALLAKLRYNRLVDIFLGITAYSLQSHLRTTVRGVGQIEIDEVYVGINRCGTQFIVPVQAKGASEQLSAVQAAQDIAFCRQKLPGLICRAVAAQFMKDATIALFELAMTDDDTRVLEERHYRLVPAEDIKRADLEVYRRTDPSLR